MATEHVQRRLAAILAADVAGYSRLVGMDEEGTHVRLQDHLRSLIDPKIAEHGGRVVKYTGDGLLAEFSSVVEAVRCAVEVQRGMVERSAEVPQEKRIEFRVGIHQGDIIIDRTDIFGDGVNVAARLESLAEPAGICVSGRVQEDTEGKLDITFENAGEQQLKNIARPVRVYRVRLSGVAPSSGSALSLPDKPSIAVLPFQNMSGDPEQEYFADGIVDDIITALSHFSQLFVIARNSSFTYKGQVVGVKQIGRELGVRYVLEGSVRKAGNRARITAQLIDVASDSHLWADRFDEELEDIFALQDQVTARVIGAIAPKLEQAEIERAKRKPTESLDAYDYFLRGMAKFYQWTREAHEEALSSFNRAIELDPEFASAYGMAARCYVWRKANRWVTDSRQEVARTEWLARHAVELGKDDAIALCSGGSALAFVVGDLDDAAVFIDRALVLNPNLATVWLFSGWVRIYRGEPDTALKQFSHSMRLSPLDPLMFTMETGMAFAHFFSGAYNEASSWAEKAIHERPAYLTAAIMATASAALAEQLPQLQISLSRLHQLDPKYL